MEATCPQPLGPESRVLTGLLEEAAGWQGLGGRGRADLRMGGSEQVCGREGEGWTSQEEAERESERGRRPSLQLL